MASHLVFCQAWEESERGWGSRPDGFSYHSTNLAAAEYISRYWESQPTNVPDEYSRPVGPLRQVYVTDEVYSKMMAEKFRSLRSFKSLHSKTPETPSDRIIQLIGVLSDALEESGVPRLTTKKLYSVRAIGMSGIAKPYSLILTADSEESAKDFAQNHWCVGRADIAVVFLGISAVESFVAKATQPVGKGNSDTPG